MAFISAHNMFSDAVCFLFLGVARIADGQLGLDGAAAE
jgi:hypothetical protein